MKQRKYTTIVVFVVLDLLGVLALPKIPLSFTKGSHGNILYLSYAWPNALPENIENKITAPIESILGTVAGIKNTKSTSMYGSGLVSIEMSTGSNIEQIRLEIASVIRRVFPKLPKGVSYPVLSNSSNNSDLATSGLLTFQVNGNAAPSDLRKWVEESIKFKISRIYGVQSVEILGAEANEWSITYSAAALSALKLQESDLVSTIQKYNKYKNLGWLRSTEGRMDNVIVENPLKSRELNSIQIGVYGGRILKLSDIATVENKEKLANSHFRLNGKNAVEVIIFGRKGINEIAVTNQIRKVLHDSSYTLPKGYGMRTDYDVTDLMLGKWEQMIWYLAVTLVVFLLSTASIFRNWKVCLLMAFSLMTCVLVTSLIYYVFKIQIYFFSLPSFVVALACVEGMMLIYSYDHFVNGNRGTIKSIFGISLITFSTLSVSWFLPENVRAEFSDFSLSLILMQFVSLIVSGFLIPAMAEKSVFFKFETHNVYTKSFITDAYLKIIIFLSVHKKILITSLLFLFGLPIFLLPKQLGQGNALSKVYNNFFGGDDSNGGYRPIIEKTLGGYLTLFNNHIQQSSFYSSNEQTALHINVQIPNNSADDQVIDILKYVESEIGPSDKIDRFITRVYNKNHGGVVVYFKKAFSHGLFPYQLKSKIVKVSSQMSGIGWDIFGVGEGFNFDASEDTSPTFQILLKGYSYHGLKSLAEKLRDILMSHPRVQDVNINKVSGNFNQNGLFSYYLKADLFQLALGGVSKYDLFKSVESFNNRPDVDFHAFIEGEYYGMSIRPRFELPFDVAALRSEPLILSDSIRIKLGGKSELERQEILPVIAKDNRQFLRTISFKYLGNAQFGESYLDKILAAFSSEIDMGYSTKKISYDLEIADRIKYVIILAPILVVFIISSAMFESFQQPFILLFAIPIAYVGIFASFYYSGAGFDQGGYASFFFVSVIMTTLVVILINKFNSQMNSQIETNGIEVLCRTIVCIIRPLVSYLTILFLSLMPFLYFGSEQSFWYSFSIGALGGILASTVVIFWVVPALLFQKSK